MSIKSQDDYLRFEGLCQDFYSKPTEAPKIDEILNQYFLNPNFLAEYKQILSFTKNSYVIAHICRGLTKCVTQYWPSLTPVQRNEMKSTIWQFFEHLPAIEPFAYNMILLLHSRIIKFLWQDFDKDDKQMMINMVQTLLNQSPQHHIMGLRVLREIILEFNKDEGSHLTSLQHRNISIALRDFALLQFYTISLESLNNSLQGNGIYEKMRDAGLDLSLACLSFNFIKTTTVDTNDEVQTIQVPSDWKKTFEDPKTMQLYFNLYNLYNSTKSLECLLQVISVRKSLFVEDDRLKFLSNFIRGTREILAKNVGFQDDLNHLAFSRILDRVKSNYHLSILMSVSNYSEWLEALSIFTVRTLESPSFSPNSIIYLLSLWSKLVTSLNFVKGDPNKSQLDKYTPAIIKTFIQNKIEKSSYTSDEDELLMDYEKMLETLDVLPPLGRLTYGSTCSQLKQICDTITMQFKQETNIKNLIVIYRQLSWLIYIIGSMVFGRNTSNASDEFDKLDGDLSLRVFLIMSIGETKIQQQQQQQLVNSNGNSQITPEFEDTKVSLDLSFLYFMQKFRLVYIGDTTISSSNIYKYMTEQGAPTDNVKILLLIINRIAFNLKYWPTRSEIIKKSLELFWEIVNGHSTGKLLYDHSITKEFLKNHGPMVFMFLDHPINVKNRTLFYKILAKLLFVDDNIHLFDDFMRPFSEIIQQLLEIQNINIFRSEEVKRKIIGLLRDLRGINQSISSKRGFLLFFEWLNPKFSELFQKILNVFWGHHDVANVILKFISEYVHNKSSRMIFDNYSPNGYIIFRDTSKIISTYSTSIISVNYPTSELYPKKIKNIQTTMQIFSHYLHGNYCNFGVFELYGDNCFKLTLDSLFKLIQSIPLDQLLTYPKTAKIYGIFLEVITNFPQLLLDQSTTTFYHVMSSLHRLLESNETPLYTNACSSIEKLVVYAYQQIKNTKNQTLIQCILHYFIQETNIILQTIDKLIQIISHEDNYNQFVVSKLLLACIIFSQDSLFLVREKYHRSLQHIASPEKIDKLFNILIEDVQMNLDTKNKDKFTINTVSFRKEFKSLLNSSRFQQ